MSKGNGSPDNDEQWVSGARFAPPEALRNERYSRRQFLVYSTAMKGGNVWIAMEAVASWALEHPEVDMDETMTWAEWEASIT